MTEIFPSKLERMFYWLFECQILKYDIHGNIHRNFLNRSQGLEYESPSDLYGYACSKQSSLGQ